MQDIDPAFNCSGPPPAELFSENIKCNVLLQESSCDTDYTLICIHMSSVAIIRSSIGRLPTIMLIV